MAVDKEMRVNITSHTTGHTCCSSYSVVQLQFLNFNFRNSSCSEERSSDSWHTCEVGEGEGRAWEIGV